MLIEEASDPSLLEAELASLDPYDALCRQPIVGNHALACVQDPAYCAVVLIPCGNPAIDVYIGRVCAEDLSHAVSVTKRIMHNVEEQKYEQWMRDHGSSL